MDRGVGVLGLAKPSFSRIFLNLTRPLSTISWQLDFKRQHSQIKIYPTAHLANIQQTLAQQ